MELKMKFRDSKANSLEFALFVYGVLSVVLLLKNGNLHVAISIFYILISRLFQFYQADFLVGSKKYCNFVGECMLYLTK